jgi:ribonuclease Z
MATITFLGTSCMTPTKDRNHPSFFFHYEKHGFLFDCGEGTQRQLKIANIRANRINKIFITHWHGDHVLGIPGLIQTLGANEYNGSLEIYGPVGTKERMKYMLKAFLFDNKVDFKVFECKNDDICFEDDDLKIISKDLTHSIKTIGYAIIFKDKISLIKKKIEDLMLPIKYLQKLKNNQDIIFQGKTIRVSDVSTIKEGKKISYISDTKICNNAIELAKDSDLLITECTYLEKQEEQAQKYMHLTTKDATTIANLSNSKHLVVTHLSQRYKESKDMQEELKNYFSNSTVSYDFMKLKI